MHYKEVVLDMLKPHTQYASAIDTLLAIGKILETREKLTKGTGFTAEDFDESILNAMFALGFYPFYNYHGGSLRPLFIQAVQSGKDTFVVDFFKEAIPCAITCMLPSRQSDYSQIRKTAEEKLKS